MKEKNRFPTTPGERRDPSIVSGEIETGETPIDRAASLEALQGDFLRDGQLANDWQETAGEADARQRVEALLDRLNAQRRELSASDADPGYKDARDRMLSDLINRLRELI